MDKPYVAVARAEDIRDGSFLKVIVQDQSYLIAHVDGRYYACEDNCSHEDYPLSYGCLHGDQIKCSLHGSRFSLATGEPQDEPADSPIKTYRCALADGWVWIDPSTPANR